MPSPDAQERPIATCGICGRCFGKQEHLVRHMRIHTRERPYPCPSCHKSFSRRDVLSRHIAAHDDHGNTTSQLAGSRACFRCAADRVKCSRGQKCRRCSQRGYNCQYPPLRAARNRTVAPGTNDSINTFNSSSLEPDDTNRASNGELMITNFNDAIPESSLSAWTWSTSVNTMVSPDAFGLPGLSLSDTNWLSPGPIDLDALLANIGENAHGNAEQWSCSIATTTPSAPAIPTVQPSPHLNTTDFNTENAPREVTLERSASISENRYYVDGTGARAPFGGKGQHSICSEETIDLEEEEANVAITPVQTLNRSSLCPLAAYQSLIEGIATESRKSLIEVNPSSLPTHEQVAVSVRQYFECFHPIFPFLRRSSFALDASKSWLLLLAVSVVGSRYLQLSQHVRLSEQLFDLLGAILTRCKYGIELQVALGDKDVDYVPSCPAQFDIIPSISVLQAGILNIACMLHSGRKALIERALVERHYLVEACHSLQLLVQSKRPYNFKTTTNFDHDDLHVEWQVKESKIRTGMMIWTVDTLFVYEFQAKPLLRIEDIATALPCHEDVWEHPALIQQNQKSNPDITLTEALEMMYVEKRLPTGLGEFSMGLLVTTIYRHTVDILARDRIQLNSWTPTSIPQRRNVMSPVQQDWLPTTRLATKWRNSACDCLDVLHWPANSKVARHSGFEHHTILQLHLARLIILAPTSAIQKFASGSASIANIQSDRESQSSATARIQVLQWVIRDHCKARLCLVHCGALFWHIRRYSCSSLLEPYAVYIATLVLWAFCICMQLPEAVEAIASESDEEPEPSFLHLDRPLDDELVQTYVRMGHKMSAYIANVGSLEHEAAPMRIAREGISLLAKDTEHASGSDYSSPSVAKDVCYTWGIERSYISLLHLLAKAQ